MAVYDVNLRVELGEIVSIIGPNGAGKTTIFNMISGVLPPTGGSICFEGHVLNGLKPHRINSLGLARTFQSVQLFGNMTVLENVMVGRHGRTRQPRFNWSQDLLRECSMGSAHSAGVQQVRGFQRPESGNSNRAGNARTTCSAAPGGHTRMPPAGTRTPPSISTTTPPPPGLTR